MKQFLILAQMVKKSRNNDIVFICLPIHIKSKSFICRLYNQMNNLEKLKQKMMIKPKVEEREKIAVVIKSQKKAKVVAKDLDLAKEKEEEPETPLLIAPIIVDETHKGFDRNTLLDKLKQSKLSKVSIKPIIAASEQKPASESVAQKPVERVKKATKVIKTQLLMIEEDDEEGDK